MMPHKGRALVAHYQKTYELTYRLWEQRNRTFLFLLGAVSALPRSSWQTKA
jgi:hypothetical protein